MSLIDRSNWKYYISGKRHTLEVGTFLQSGHGTVYQIVQKYPSIGGTTEPKVTLKHLRSDEDYTWNLNEMRYHRLRVIEPEEVPLALLGEA